MPGPITMAGGPPAEALLEAMSEAVYAVDRNAPYHLLELGRGTVDGL